MQPWLPSRRLYVVTERRRQIEAKIAEFRATGGIADSKYGGAADGSCLHML